MKKIMFWIIIATLVVFLGRSAYTMYEEMNAKRAFVDWIHAVEVEEIELWGACDTRNGDSMKDIINWI